jgi:hypothetical protein
MRVRAFIYGARLAELDPATSQRAILDDWELSVSVPSADWDGAIGTIVPRAGSGVYGVIVDQAQLTPDVPEVFQPLQVEARIWVPGGAASTVRLEQCLALVAPEPAHVTAQASSRWIETVARAARALALPDEWLETLERSIAPT